MESASVERVSLGKDSFCHYLLFYAPLIFLIWFTCRLTANSKNFGDKTPLICWMLVFLELPSVHQNNLLSKAIIRRLYFNFKVLYIGIRLNEFYAKI